jgi:hypothetical protein
MKISSKVLAKIRIAVKVCRIGIWVIVALWLAEVVANIANIAYEFSQPGQPTAFNLNQYMYIISTLFASAIPAFFFVVVLYITGTILGCLLSLAKTSTPEENDEHLEIVSIPD